VGGKPGRGGMAGSNSVPRGRAVRKFEAPAREEILGANLTGEFQLVRGLGGGGGAWDNERKPRGKRGSSNHLAQGTRRGEIKNV